MAIAQSSHLMNPLATSLQLETSASQADGVPSDIELSVRFSTVRLMQAAGVLLRLPQDLIAQAIVVLYRYWVGSEGGSLLEHDAKDVAAAAMYLTAKPSGHPVTPRQLLSAFAFLSSVSDDLRLASAHGGQLDSEWSLSEGELDAGRVRLYEIESRILRVLGFQTNVALPHALCINYLQTMDAVKGTEGAALAKRALAHLNSALQSPQLLYLTHQPSAIATAAIYLAARECNVKLPETEWWEVFDVDREELGFLVVALRSLEAFAIDEKQKWSQQKVPMTVEETRLAIRPSVQDSRELSDGMRR